MANTINDLYSKYTTKVERTLEKDRYFQYLFEMVQAGHNTLQQKNRVLHKVVDERWLGVVEEGIDAIFRIVDKPRRFIATSEEVVPVALAKKITADSVRHLSQNTQFIATNAAGEIQPTRILNVTTEESFDLYENRFVYHLIQRLFAFVDKRTDVIFWSTGDETCNVMSMESKIDDAYEEISYKVEMTIKNRQSFVENDADNMDVFKRIDRVRRMSRTLRSSSFCDIMNGCAKVRSPIQRTNLMMKDPDYRTCYKLWQFMENYDEIGYTIEEQDTALEFDEEYLLQMYINLITNYTVFKSLLESDPRKMTEISTKKRKPIKPKFIKKIEEQIVDSPDIEEVEIRQVFVEEVTQAQLDAEAKLKEETELREELENSVSEMQFEIDSLNQQMEFLDQMQQEAEIAKEALQEQLDAAVEAKASAEAAMEAADTEAKLAIDIAREEAKAAMEAAQQEAAEKVEAAEKQAAEAVEATEKKAAETVEATEKKAAETVAAMEKKAAETVKAAETKAAQEVETAQTQAKAAIEAAEQKSAMEIKDAQDEAKSAVEMAEMERQKADEARMAMEKQLEEFRREMQERLAESERKLAAATKAQQEAEEQTRKALAKAEANSLSHYIVSALKERRNKEDK